MKRILWLVLVVLFLTAGNLYAHCGKCGVGDEAVENAAAQVDEKVAKLTEDLGLDDEQKARLKVIIQEKMDKKQQIMADKHKAMDALHEDFQAKLKEVLTAEQFKKWEAIKADKAGMESKCPMCKEGKMCAMCLLKKKGMGESLDHK